MRNEEQGSHFGGAPRSGERVDPEVPEPAGETGGPLAVDEVFASLVQREVLSVAKRRDC